MADMQQDLIAQQKKYATKKVLADVASFHTGLVTNFKKEHKKLPESLFILHFLPYFSGEKKIEEKSTVLADWFSIAGNHTAEVTIIDDVTLKPLFDVPPVSGRTRTNTTYNTQRKMMSLDDVAHMASQLNSTIPGRGNRFAADAFSNRVEVLLDKNNPVSAAALTDIDKDMLQWAEIFKRYGLIKAVVGTTDTAQSSSTDEDMYFE